MKRDNNTDIAYFAAGCFWGVETAFRKISGVTDVIVGYTGGHIENPTYADVCRGDTGHAEAVEVVYDSEKVSYKMLVDAFWKMHDPTTLNRQGPDVGEQYRSAIFYLDLEQKSIAEASKLELQSSDGMRNKKVVTDITQAGVFYPAEEYHQRYFEKKGIDPTCHV